MSDMEKLPKDGRNQEIGRMAKRALGIKLPKAWVEKELDGDTDFGIDYIMQLKNVDDDVSFSFYFQLKGTTTPDYSADRQYISHEFKVSTLNYYHRQEPLVMVAVVDLKENEDELWKCPIYYYWLDDSWYSENKGKLLSQTTITVKIPITQIISNSLDIFDYYSDRIKEKFAVSDLKSEIKSKSRDIVQSLSNITEAISEKPILLKTVEINGDEPWIENPKGEYPTLLKECADFLNSNLIFRAQGKIDEIKENIATLSAHELAELHYQQANILARQGDDQGANKNFEAAYKICNKDRYKIAFFESKFRLDPLPSEDELVEIIKSLSSEDYRNTILKAKCLTLIGKSDNALDILKDKHSNRPLGQLLIMLMADRILEANAAIKNFDILSLENDRERFLFHSLAARRFLDMASQGKLVGKNIHTRGYVNSDLNEMKNALQHVEKAWSYAHETGYPSDVTILFDVSPLIFGYFNLQREMYSHLESLLHERPNHVPLIKLYSRLIFNDQEYDRAIELLSRVKSKIGLYERGMLILCNYYLKRFHIALRLIEDNYDALTEDEPENTALIFCIGAELARHSLDDKLEEKYINVLSRLDKGHAFLALSNFMDNCKKNPENQEEYVNQLYGKYIEYDKPVIIAEHIIRFLNPRISKSALLMIEISQQLMAMYELKEMEYFKLAEAYINTTNFDEAIKIAEQHIERGNFHPHWNLVKASCLQNKGKPGLAHQQIVESLEQNRNSIDYLKQYVNLSLQFGLSGEVEEVLVSLFENTENRDEKLRFLSILISIYSTKSGNEEKLTKAVMRFGHLVNKENGDEEAQFLIYFLMLQGDQDPSHVKNFQQRLSDYSTNFPNSQILRQGTLDLDNGPEKLINSLNQLIGITPEQIRKWENNRNQLRSGRLPVPFVMLDRFLRDTRDLFTTWVLSKNSREEEIELKLIQSPQLDQTECDRILSNYKTLIIEDTSLLILSDIGLLDKLMQEVSEIALLETSFERIANSIHPIGGTVYNLIPQQLLQIINSHKEKLKILPEGDNNGFDAIRDELIIGSSALLTDDLRFMRFTFRNDTSLPALNSFNIVEYLFNRGTISTTEKFTYMVRICALGIHQPNMSIRLLAESLNFYVQSDDEKDYSNTDFKIIFDKVFSSLRLDNNVINVFLDMILCATRNTKFPLRSEVLLPLFNGFLIRHQFSTMESFITFWFIFQSVGTPVKIESKLIESSADHVKLWDIYVKMNITLISKQVFTQDLLVRIVMQIFALDEDIRTIAFESIKSCFIPLTQESQSFINLYNQAAISHRFNQQRI